MLRLEDDGSIGSQVGVWVTEMVQPQQTTATPSVFQNGIRRIRDFDAKDLHKYIIEENCTEAS